MNTTNTANSNKCNTKWYFVAFFLLMASYGISQTNPPAQDSTKTGIAYGDIKFPNPGSIESKYTYDPILDRYVYTEKIGKFNTKFPLILTPAEFEKLILKEKLNAYYKAKIDAKAGQKDGAEDAQKDLLPEYYVNSDFFESLFGGNTISVIPRGSVDLDLGVLFTKQDNPIISPRNRSNFTFDFDQRISMSLTGKVGTRLQVNAQYDTERTFDFQNLVKLEYTPTEDDIVQKVEIGNVNMPLNSSLITGAQSLFGVKTELQFGKTRVTAVFSEQQSIGSSVSAQGGGTLEEFEFFARDYDENRHYFLAQHFRDDYDRAMLTYPYINNNTQIARVEVWVTNRNNQTDNVRNIVAFQDLGESEPENIGLDNAPAGFINIPNALPNNPNNELDPTNINNINGMGSILNDNVRDITNVQNGVTVAVNEGTDYGILESARKLVEGQDFTLNPQLGYISLNQRLLNDEVLAVAFQYTSNGQVYQVGEFGNDGVDAAEVVEGTNGNQLINNQSLVLKMLKSALTAVNEPIWDLMMKNVYNTGAFQLSQQDFVLNIFYTEASALNYITPVENTTFPIFGNNTSTTADDTEIEETPLIRLFHLDRLNFNNDPQEGGDGFFDFVPGQTVLVQNGNIIFTKVEPFGEYLFDVLDDPNTLTENYEDPSSYNPNQANYVYDLLYTSTKTQALDDAEKNKFQIKGRYQSSDGGGIPIPFNAARGSVRVTAGGQLLVEGQDYIVNYSRGRVEILDESLRASNTPINVSVENNSLFGQQTRRFTGVNVEHQFNENFLLGATFLNLSERPITQKANFDTEPINNTIFGINGNFATEVPFLTRLANKLPNIDTDVPSNFSVRGEFAYLAPGAPKGTDFNGEATAYIDDFEGNQGSIQLLSPFSWSLSSRPQDLGRVYAEGDEDVPGIQNGFDRALLNWYTVDPIFYGPQRPSEITDDDVSDLYARRVFIREVFPERDLVQGQLAIIPTLDLAYYPTERGPYNFNPTAANNAALNPTNSWAGITRQITSTDFEQANVEYIEFWVQDPFLDNPTNPGGRLTVNLGNISEDILKDGKKLYENGLPEDGNIDFLQNIDVQTPYIVPQNQSLIYTFGTTGQERTNQDVGYDGYDDAEEQDVVTFLEGLTSQNLDFGADPANDNYSYFLNTEGNIFERYKRYNGVEGNTPDTFSQTNRGATTVPDVEDVNRDNTMNTIDAYFEFDVDITPTTLNANNPLINDSKTTMVDLPNGDTREVTWYQFRLPISEPTRTVGGIADIRSVRFARLYLTEFTQNTVLRFATLDLVRSDWRRFTGDLDNDTTNNSNDAEFNVAIIGIQENDGNYVIPPGVQREELSNNNNVIRQNEQSLVLEACDFEIYDSRGVFKNISLDMRQYKRLRMFLHAESQENQALNDGELVAFIRLGNDFTDNFYQIEVPLLNSELVSDAESLERQVWPLENEINIPLTFLQEIKARGISNQTLSNEDPTYYDIIDGELSDASVPEFPPLLEGIQNQRVAIKGNPNFGNVRVLMVGLKHSGQNRRSVCGEVWFNELRMSDLENEGGWAAIMAMDANVADFATIAANGQMSTIGFGGIEQTPNERSREDVQQYNVTTSMQLGQLFPEKWGIQLPFNYSIGEELVTPQYDQLYNDLTLDSRLEAAETDEERDIIKNQSETYTKRQSINFIGVKKNRTGEKKPKFYDVENLTFNYSYNKEEHRNFEIERSLQQNIRTGVNYNFNFQPKKIEPFKKNDSIFKSKYWKFLKDFNINLLPTSFSVKTNINRSFNSQKFREVSLVGNNIGIPELFRRNYTFDFQYAINYNLTDALNVNFSANNNNIVRNYFIDDRLNGRQNPDLNIWDGFFDFGDPNIQSQQISVNYKLPFDKIPILDFLQSTYSYSGNFQWTKGSDLNANFEATDEDGNPLGTFNLGNSIQNASTHTLNTILNMESLYRQLGIKSSRRNNANVRRSTANSQNQAQSSGSSKKKKGFSNALLDIVTMVKRVSINYVENGGTFLPGYVNTPGFIGTLKPSLGFTFGSQRDIRQSAARNGYLTNFQNFNQQFTQNEDKRLNYTAALEPTRDLKIDLIGSRNIQENFAENFRVDQSTLNYIESTPNNFGNFNISTALIGTSFSKSDENSSATFDEFRANRLIVANRLAQDFYGNTTFPRDADGFPVGFGRTNQKVLLPAFLAAYHGSNAESVSLRTFRDFPIPNWTLKYTGFMKLPWFKKNFKRFSLQHGYRSSYNVLQFRKNLDFDSATPDAVDQNGNFKNETILSGINLEESFSPLFRIEATLKNSLQINAEMRKNRLLSLSFDNNLVTEEQSNEYVLGLGYRIKDIRLFKKIGGRNTIKSDLNLSLDANLRDNLTIIRYLDIDDNQITAGQTIFGAKFNAEYAFSRNFTSLFFFDYSFSDFAISTSFPQTTIRSGFTLRYNFGN